MVLFFLYLVVSHVSAAAMCAASEGHDRVLSVLMKHPGQTMDGELVKAKDLQGRTCLHFAGEKEKKDSTFISNTRITFLFSYVYTVARIALRVLCE
jgi:hypothetical protein